MKDYTIQIGIEPKNAIMTDHIELTLTGMLYIRLKKRVTLVLILAAEGIAGVLWQIHITVYWQSRNHKRA